MSGASSVILQNQRSSVLLRSYGHLATSLAEPRSAAGSCLLPLPHPFTPDDEIDEAGCLDEGGEVDQTATPTTTHLVLIAGGYSQNRCLKSTEILRFTETVDNANADLRRGSILSADSVTSDVESAGAASCFSCAASAAASAGWSLESTSPGPEMLSARGRLAIASPDAGGSIYVCGGSDGHRDLASVEL